MSIPYTHESFKATLNHLKSTFQTAAKNRKVRERINEHGEPAWMTYERETMHSTVNQLRRTLGLEPIPIEEIIKVENCASGHVDYATKFPLYCTELVFSS